jgi:hypothetical protein
MADTKISSLSEVTSINNADYFLAIQGGVPKKVQARNMLPLGSISAADVAAYAISSGIYTSQGQYATGTPSDAGIETVTFGFAMLNNPGDILEIEALFFVTNAVNTGVAKIKVVDLSSATLASHASETINGSVADYVIMRMRLMYYSSTTAIVQTEVNHYTAAGGLINTSKTKLLHDSIGSIPFANGFKITTAAYAASGAPVVKSETLNIRLIRKI